MILASRLVSDVKEDFEGGASLSVNWASVLRRAAQKLLKNINPDTLHVRAAVYGGITKDAYVHYMPAEVAKPTGLYMKDGTRSWDYQAPRHFFERNEADKFTVASMNGVRFLVVRHSESGSTLVIDDMDDVTGMTGTATPAVNDQNFLSGDSAVQASFTDAGLTLIRTMDDPADLTDYLRGTVIIPIHIDDASKVASIKLQLRTDSSNYYEVTTTADSISHFLIDGWNFIRFNMGNRTTTGSPTVTNIVDWKLTITADASQTVVCVIDRMTIQLSAPLWLNGYRDKIFVDATTGAYKADVDEDVDSVAIGEDLADILHYEMCLLINGKSNIDFSAQLARAYATYYENHPSEELPVTYNIQPDLNRSTPSPSDAATDSEDTFTY